MYKVIDGDLLNAKTDFIAHQVNCSGAMRSGVAKAIREKYPEVYNQYIDMYNAYSNQLSKDDLLGKVQYVNIADYSKLSAPYYCINMFAQLSYGYDGRQYTNLDAFRCILKDINIKCSGKSVAFPYMIGCVRGGADWNVVSQMINDELTDLSEIVFYRL